MAWDSSTRRSRLPTDWPSLRRMVLTRDGGRCQQCGSLANQVDHVQAGDDHSPDNLQSLCQPCHQAKTQAESAAARRATAKRARHPRESHPGWGTTP